MKTFIKYEEEALASAKRVIISPVFKKAVNFLAKTRGRIIVSGIGKSGHIAMKISSTLTSIGISSAFLHAGEAAHGELGMISGEDALITISNSGETKELIRIVKHVSRHGIGLVTITGNSNSTLARLSHVVLAFGIKGEGSPFNIAPMASATASLVLGDALAAGLSAKRGFSKEEFADLHPGGALGLRLSRVEELMIHSKDVPLIRERASFQDALKVITGKKFGITGVVNEESELIGVITDGDIRRFLLSPNFSLASLACEVMTKNPKTIYHDASLQDALTKMEDHKITSLFVVDSLKRPLGIIHMHSIIESRII